MIHAPIRRQHMMMDPWRTPQDSDVIEPEEEVPEQEVPRNGDEDELGFLWEFTV